MGIHPFGYIDIGYNRVSGCVWSTFVLIRLLDFGAKIEPATQHVHCILQRVNGG